MNYRDSLTAGRFDLNSAADSLLGSLRPLAATGGEKSGCHPEGDLRSSWKFWTVNPVPGAAADEPPDLGLASVSRLLEPMRTEPGAGAGTDRKLR